MENIEIFLILYVILYSMIELLIHLIPAMIICKRYAEEVFACPNCGKHFHVKWYKLIRSRGQIALLDQAILRCPGCGKKDICCMPGRR